MENPFQPVTELLLEVIQRLKAIDEKITPETQEQDVNFTKAELANFLHCCEKTIDNYRAEGLPDLQNKKGRKLLFSRNEAISFLKNKNIVSSRGANTMQQLNTHTTSE